MVFRQVGEVLADVIADLETGIVIGDEGGAESITERQREGVSLPPVAQIAGKPGANRRPGERGETLKPGVAGVRKTSRPLPAGGENEPSRKVIWMKDWVRERGHHALRADCWF